MSGPVQEISARELKARLDAGNPPTVLDVRKDWELELARLPGAVHIPMGQIPQRLGELDPASDIVVLCRVGGRSMQVAQFLAARGFRRVANLSGGILAWSRDVDPQVAPY